MLSRLQVISALKAELKHQGYTYLDVATQQPLSHASV